MSLAISNEITAYALSLTIRLVFLADGYHSYKPRKTSGHTYDENIGYAV